MKKEIHEHYCGHTDKQDATKLYKYIRYEMFDREITPHSIFLAARLCMLEDKRQKVLEGDIPSGLYGGRRSKTDKGSVLDTIHRINRSIENTVISMEEKGDDRFITLSLEVNYAYNCLRSWPATNNRALANQVGKVAFDDMVTNEATYAIEMQILKEQELAEYERYLTDWYDEEN